jgi:hypothetical protein
MCTHGISFLSTRPFPHPASPQGITHVDVMSIDTENSEVPVLQGLDFDAVTVDVFVIEDPYATGVRRPAEGGSKVLLGGL